MALDWSAPAAKELAAGQAVQTSAPSVAEKKPASQGLQMARLLSACVPFTHVVHAEEAPWETLPAAQAVQASEPSAAEKKPASQGLQTVPDVAKWFWNDEW